MVIITVLEKKETFYKCHSKKKKKKIAYLDFRFKNKNSSRLCTSSGSLKRHLITESCSQENI